MIIDEDAYLMHYGILRKSGRYPWGSGEDVATRNKTFLGIVEQHRKDGMSETEIARGYGMTTSELRNLKSISNNREKREQIDFAQRLKDKGTSNIEIGKRMNLNESSVRALLAPGAKDKADILTATSTMLRKQVEEKGYVDVGTGVELHSGLTRTKLDTALFFLKEEGYVVKNVQVDQAGTQNKTTIKVLAAPGTEYKEIARNLDNIKQITDFSQDGGRSYLGLHPPLHISSTRVGVRYAEDGGAAEDGVMYVRPGVKDVGLGASRYAQVRVGVDGTHFIKGMAMYKDGLPEGVDILFNTNKTSTGNKLDALKPLKKNKQTGEIDNDNPFGAVIKAGGQQVELDSKGNQKVVSVMNKVNEEGDWEKWSKSLSRQVLSKQTPELATEQLGMTYERKQNELKSILKLSNPTVRAKLLESFADDADSSAVHMKAAALPRQASHVILPLNSLKPTEIYAPNFHNGERVVLVRFPHAGTFELPELVVNNNHPEGKKVIGQARDAVGIHTDVAARLSGADFDGDTVLVIPNNHQKIHTDPALEGLKGFDPQHAYPAYEGMEKLSDDGKQHKMGDITNLISDMTIQGAPNAELARAVRHSMVIIDAAKHDLNHKQSYIDNGIKQLKIKYQGVSDTGNLKGASTLITRAKTDVRVNERTPRKPADGGPIDPATGKKVFTETGASYVTKDGKLVIKTTKVKKLELTDDAHTLSSGTKIETVYANHSNKLKDLANQARKELVTTGTVPYSPSAKTAYRSEVTSLNAKLNTALKNAPLERQAQLLANSIVQLKKQDYPDMDKSDLKKIKGQAITEARLRTGAGKTRVDITDNEWAAIQAGAISTNKLKQILNNSDIEQIKQLATPRDKVLVSASMKSRATSMAKLGYTQADIAAQLGISVSSLKIALPAATG